MPVDLYLSCPTFVNMNNHRLLFLAILFLIFSCKQETSNDEHSTKNSLADLKVYDGLQVKLFASEPMFTNPTNISVDSRGRVWVCEAYNYRNTLNPKNPVKAEGDRIMILEDTDHDGIADKSKVFYQGTDVNAALGICVIGNRVFVSCSPNVFVFTDEDGDDVPEKKETLFTGIRGEQHDHGMHSFTFGPDGRLYFNMGNAADGLLTANKDTVIDIHGRKVWNRGNPFYQGMALRCEPDGSNVEVLGHNFRNNFELTVDPYGTVWQSDNDDDGNKGTRINYVMEQGNFGYTDEMTGAGWYARRTNMEKEIPLRHWHLNDPGVVPNVLQTGSGSPSGMTMYEGIMLPEIFQGQMLHAEPGHNVVRAYPIENDGAGYKATIVNLLEGQKDQWFRPIDVTSGPDGSIFIADWYDPGVGGHQVGDLDRGRIYRVTPPDTKYEIPTLDLSTPEGAVKCLLNPNNDIRYQGWMALKNFGASAESELQKLWTGKNQRQRAQALWLLARLDGKSDQYIEQAISDNDPNIRITGLRVARQLKKDVLPIVAKLVKDPSPQVRRDAILALRGNKSQVAANLWTSLANQYDGKDRWYLEALGIGAAQTWDLYFATWKKQVGKDWNSPVNRDIVWRSRSKEAVPLLAQLIKSSDEKEMLRYFRAFDFHKDPSKQQVLAQLATTSKDSKVLYALKHMDASKFKMTPVVMATLNKVLDQNKGKLEFVELTSAFKLENKSNDLLALCLQYPDSASGKEAAKTLLNWNKIGMFKKVFDQNNKNESKALVKALSSSISNKKTQEVIEALLMDSTKDVEIRALAVRAFRGPWDAEDRLLELAKDKKLPKDLYVAAGGVFQTAYRSSIRDDGAKYLGLPGSKEGKPISSISVLVDKSGDASKGKEVFKNVCSTCHQVNKEGVNFGPDLSEIGDKLPKQALYTSILFPDQGISFGFEAYQIKLKDGSTAFGRIVSQTEDKIDLQYISNQQTINRADVVSKTQLETSLMPANLQSTMSEDDLVNLVEYLKALKKQSIAAK
jgi:putative membrane-bound dehydrogenase-like protein